MKSPGASNDESVPEEAVKVDIVLEGKMSDALLDSCASVSVIDLKTLQDKQLKWKLVPWQESVKSFDNSSRKTVGYVHLDVGIGSQRTVPQKFTVIKCKEPITILLGRDFLHKHNSTEFNWEKGQIRINKEWITPHLWLRGGSPSARVAATHTSEAPIQFDINPDLNNDQKSQLLSLLREYEDCFALNPKKPSATSMGEHVIETLPGAQPRKAKRYRMSPQQEEEVTQQSDEMLKNGIIRPSNSPWAHNVILVKNGRTGKVRFVIDYRPLNEVTVKDAYPMPNVREIVDKMRGSKYFCKMDMASAYWAVPIKEEDREKTAFMTPRRLYEMCVTGYGLCNSQATYQRIMDDTLSGLENTASFIDDVNTFNNTFDDMLTTLRQTLDRLRAAKLQMRTEKCKFGYTEIDYVGYHISSKGLSPIQANIEAITSFPAPTNIKELERFVGMSGYYREFMPRMAEFAEPLNRLRKKGQPFVWSDECEAAFKQIKLCLASPPVLAFPDWSAPFYIEAEACDHSVGGTLSQKDDRTGKLRPLGYFSIALEKSQKHYDARHKECWALVAGTRKWSAYCRAATKVMLVSDHNPLRWLRDQTDPRGKFARWLMELEHIPYQIVYRNGLDHTVPDCLSRASNAKHDAEICDEEEHFENRIFAIRSSDPWLKRVAEAQKEDEAVNSAIQTTAGTPQIPYRSV